MLGNPWIFEPHAGTVGQNRPQRGTRVAPPVIFAPARAGVGAALAHAVPGSFCLQIFLLLVAIVPPLLCAIVPLATALVAPWLRAERPVYRSEPWCSQTLLVLLFFRVP